MNSLWFNPKCPKCGSTEFVSNNPEHDVYEEGGCRLILKKVVGCGKDLDVLCRHCKEDVLYFSLPAPYDTDHMPSLAKPARLLGEADCWKCVLVFGVAVVFLLVGLFFLIFVDL